ncbi:MAG: hypothetical protein KAZ88_14690, partial [Acidimicrobiia bacterium]|nr:hypothetical protein [Acidimicrobiia bacterium]
SMTSRTAARAASILVVPVPSSSFIDPDAVEGQKNGRRFVAFRRQTRRFRNELDETRCHQTREQQGEAAMNDMWGIHTPGHRTGLVNAPADT